MLKQLLSNKSNVMILVFILFVAAMLMISSGSANSNMLFGLGGVLLALAAAIPPVLRFANK